MNHAVELSTTIYFNVTSVIYCRSTVTYFSKGSFYFYVFAPRRDYVRLLNAFTKTKMEFVWFGYESSKGT